MERKGCGGDRESWQKKTHFNIVLALNQFSLSPKPPKDSDRDDLTDQLIPTGLQGTDWLLVTHGDKIVIDFPMKTQQSSQSQITSQLLIMFLTCVFYISTFPPLSTKTAARLCSRQKTDPSISTNTHQIRAKYLFFTPVLKQENK